MKDFYIGVDNGVTGSIGIINTNGGASWHKTPVRRELNYTKEEAWLNRIDRNKLKDILSKVSQHVATGGTALVILERPMINSRRWKASCSALRSFEATLTVLEDLKLPFIYVDSKEWQKVMLPSGVSGEELKTSSLQVARRLFPTLKVVKDGDAILMAEWARQKQL